MKKLLFAFLFTILFLRFFGQNPSLCGIWFGYNYNSGVSVEVLNIVQSGQSVVAIKLVGDVDVTSGMVSWFADYTTNTLAAHFTLGSSGNPNSTCGIFTLNVVDSTHITSTMLSNYFIKATCNQIDSMKYNLDSLSINCVCKTKAPLDTIVITKYDTTITIHDTIQTTVVVHDTIQTTITIRDTIRTTIRDTIHVTKYADTCLASISFPNIFTPNNDGINDFFTPVEVTNIEIETFTILNRWGEEVYKTTSKISWNGQLNNKKVSDGTYYYILQYKTKTGKKKSVNGFLSVIT